MTLPSGPGPSTRHRAGLLPARRARRQAVSERRLGSPLSAWAGPSTIGPVMALTRLERFLLALAFAFALIDLWLRHVR
jgi:hypothetical protein